MNCKKRDRVARLAAGAGALALSLALGFGAAQAQDKTYTMKIALPTINDPSFFYAKDYLAALEKDSGGRIKGEVYPSSQLGSIPRMIEGTQFGSIQCVIIPPEFFVGVDERFEVMAAGGLADSLEHAQRIAADPAMRKLMLGLGADKGLHGTGLYLNGISSVVAKTPIRRLADFKGKKIRTLASKFQTEPMDRLGANAVVMTLGDVVPAMQQGTIDGSVGSVVVFTPMHFQDAGKYITETGQPPVFAVNEINKKWYDALPPDLQKIVDDDAAKEDEAIRPRMAEIYNNARKGWTDHGGELISLSPDEQASLMKTMRTVGTEVSSAKPSLTEAFKVIADAAQRTR